MKIWTYKFLKNVSRRRRNTTLYTRNVKNGVLSTMLWPKTVLLTETVL